MTLVSIWHACIERAVSNEKIQGSFLDNYLFVAPTPVY